MKFDINDKYSISSDAYNITVQEKKINQKEGSESFGQVYYSTIGYYYKLEHALERLIDKEIIENDHELLDFMEFLNNLKKEIIDAVKKYHENKG